MCVPDRRRWPWQTHQTAPTPRGGWYNAPWDKEKETVTSLTLHPENQPSQVALSHTIRCLLGVSSLSFSASPPRSFLILHTHADTTSTMEYRLAIPAHRHHVTNHSLRISTFTFQTEVKAAAAAHHIPRADLCLCFCEYLQRVKTLHAGGVHKLYTKLLCVF